jgi:crotonyl-CoA reductase
MHPWIRLKRIVGSHGANSQEDSEANRLIGQGRIIPALSKYSRSTRPPTRRGRPSSNHHVGKVGVFCLVKRPGLGIEDAERRAELGEECLQLFRRFA